MQRAGTVMTGAITAPLAAMGGMAVRQAGRFDQAMQESIAVMGDVDQAMREDLEETANEVATSTTRSHQEVAQSFYFLASAGLDAAEAMEALPEVAEFAEAGQMNMAEATDVATNVMSAYGIEAENMTDVTDVMTQTVSSHNQTMEGMAAAFKNAAPAAASMGVEIEELAAATGALGDVGIQGAEAGTALQSIMRRLAKRSGETGQALEELGIQTTDAQGNMLPLVQIIEQLEEANMSSAQASAIFGRQMSAGSALVDAGADSLREYRANIENADGATEEMASTQRESLNAQLQMTRSNLNEAGVTIGTHLIPYIRALSESVRSATDRFESLSDRQQKAIILVGGLAAALGPVLLLLGTLGVVLPAASTALGIFAGAAGTAGSVVAGTLVPALTATTVAGLPVWALLGALAAAAGTLYVAWRENFLGMQDTTKRAFGKISGFIDWLIRKVNKIPGVNIQTKDAKQSIEDLKSSVGEAVPSIQTDIEEIDTTEGSDLGLTDDQIEDIAAESGQSAGEKFSQNFKTGAASQGKAVTGEITDELLEEFKKSEIQDIFEAREVEEGRALHGLDNESITEASKQATITPEMLGISRAEFNRIINGDSSQSSTRSSRRDTLNTPVTRTGSASAGGLSKDDAETAFKNALRAVLETARLQVEIQSTDRELKRFIDKRAEAVFQDIAGGP
jgi:TP901 family phage tail tape measure protein